MNSTGTVLDGSTLSFSSLEVTVCGDFQAS